MHYQTIILRNNEANGFEKTTYPDGQHSVQIIDEYFNVKVPILIKCSIKNFSELELLGCILAALKRNDYLVIGVQFIYLFGMRSDRVFEKYQPNYFMDVVAPLLNTILKQNRIINVGFLAPHSMLALNQIDNASEMFVNVLKIIPQPFHLLFGDKSAANKFAHKVFNIETQLAIAFEKRRAGYFGMEIRAVLENDQVLTLENEIAYNPKAPILIFDDLCDGGATFLKEAKYLIDKFPETKLHLCVMHGLFTKGFEKLLEHFEHIYTTNSYQNFSQEDEKDLFFVSKDKLTVIDVFKD